MFRCLACFFGETTFFLYCALQGTQKQADQQFAFFIDSDVEIIAIIEFEFQPRTAIGNHAAAIQYLAAEMPFAFVMVKKHAGGAVHLTDDGAFRPVNDERALCRHHRDFAEINVLLLDVANRFAAGIHINIPGDQAHCDFERNRVRHAAFPAFSGAIFRFAKTIAHKLQQRNVIVIRNGKYRLKDLLQTGILSFIRRDVELQKPFIGCLLHFDQIWDIQNHWNLAEIQSFPNSRDEPFRKNRHLAPLLSFLAIMCRGILTHCV